MDFDKYIEISVRDYGIGIDKENLSTIFSRFKQVDRSLSRNVDGSGIGLFLVQSIIELHNGKITVESEVGKGSIFKICLPSRCVETEVQSYETKSLSDYIEKINIEFSDIYSL